MVGASANGFKTTTSEWLTKGAAPGLVTPAGKTAAPCVVAKLQLLVLSVFKDTRETVCGPSYTARKAQPPCLIWGDVKLWCVLTRHHPVQL